MTFPEILMLISAVTTSIIAVMTPILGLIVKRIESKQMDNKVSTDSKLTEIHSLVDGSLSKSQDTNASLVKENLNQKEVITRLTPSPDLLMLTNKLIEVQKALAEAKAANDV